MWCMRPRLPTLEIQPGLLTVPVETANAGREYLNFKSQSFCSARLFNQGFREAQDKLPVRRLAPLPAARRSRRCNVTSVCQPSRGPTTPECPRCPFSCHAAVMPVMLYHLSSAGWCHIERFKTGAKGPSRVLEMHWEFKLDYKTPF